jgi:CheY-like chemotaxis protein
MGQRVLLDSPIAHFRSIGCRRLDVSLVAQLRHARRPTMTLDPVSPAGAAARGGRRALVVDADTATRRLCRETLEALGFIVEVVETGVAAVAAAREGPPEIIFIEAQLSDVPARTVVVWLRENPVLEGTPVVLLGGRYADGAQAKDGEVGASLAKPVSANAIRRAVGELIR